MSEPVKENDRQRESGDDGGDERDQPRSSIRPEDWLPVQEMLLRGLNHSLSNRLASLSALAMLIEGADRLDARMQQALSSDAERLGELLELFRALPGSISVRREAIRFGDALERAGALIEHHPECRDIAIAPVVESPDAPPVTLASTDALRSSVLMMLAVAQGATSPTPLMVTARSGADGFLHVTVELAGGSCERIKCSAEFAALERFAKLEGGRVHCAASGVDDGSGRLTMSLPGLGVTRGR